LMGVSVLFKDYPAGMPIAPFHINAKYMLLANLCCDVAAVVRSLRYTGSFGTLRRDNRLWKRGERHSIKIRRGHPQAFVDEAAEP
jgi:hypothetical protein